VQLVCTRGISRDWTSIEESTGTSYTEKRSLCLAFYTDCIIIVRRKEH